jgi:hypothetical protein
VNNKMGIILSIGVFILFKYMYVIMNIRTYFTIG